MQSGCDIIVFQMKILLTQTNLQVGKCYELGLSCARANLGLLGFDFDLLTMFGFPNLAYGFDFGAVI